MELNFESKQEIKETKKKRASVTRQQKRATIKEQHDRLLKEFEKTGHDPQECVRAFQEWLDSGEDVFESKDSEMLLKILDIPF